MVFKLGKFGKHLAENAGKVAQGFANKLDYAVEAPPTPALLGALAACAGVFVVKHFKARRDRKHQNQKRSPPPSEVCPA